MSPRACSRAVASARSTTLWTRLDAALAGHKVEWHWVKGHAGDPGNEQADALARQGMAPYQRSSL